MKEIDSILDIISKQFPADKHPNPEVLRSEPGLMYTIKLGDDVYKAIRLDETWKINPIK